MSNSNVALMKSHVSPARPAVKARKAGVSNDRFYTPDKTVEQLISLVHPEQYETIIEPSAGSGAILHRLPQYAVGYDLEPHADDVQLMNWLEPVDADGNHDEDMYIGDKQLEWSFGRTLVIGNPPFGRQASLASRFFNESATFADVIAFIMPKSFMKDSMMNRLDHHFHIDVMTDVVDDHYITPDGFRVVPTIIIVAHREKELRSDHIISHDEPADRMPFVFTDRDDADYMVIRVGGKSGTLQTMDKVTDKNSKYNYFIRITDDSVDINDIFTNASRRIHELRDMTTGPRSISKAELVDAIAKSM
jgi:hypothetical protein